MSDTDPPLPAPDPSPPGRRSFLDWLLGLSAVGTAAAIVYPVVHFVFPPPRPKGRAKGAVLAAQASELEPGSGKVFPLGTRPAILVHTPDGKWRAFAAKCTHLSCTVSPTAAGVHGRARGRRCLRDRGGPAWIGSGPGSKSAWAWSRCVT
jgi:Rieske Fe-S protein